MKKSKEERFSMFLISALSVQLASILIALSMVIGSVYKEQKSDIIKHFFKMMTFI